MADIASGKNSIYKDRNMAIAHIMESDISFRLIQRIVCMTSVSFLKPWQLSTVMCYAEMKYHSNDYTFMQIMADVLQVAKMQLKVWKDEKQRL